MTRSLRLTRLAAADSPYDREFAAMVRRDMPFWRQSIALRSVRRAKRFAFQMFWPVTVTTSTAIVIGAIICLVRLIQHVL